ncbi:MAG: hypothetical protein J6Y22_06260 [Paludibacteraceae bacterium]|nr:hypothetical protein [Paludibacteraceae bacterium]
MCQYDFISKAQFTSKNEFLEESKDIAEDLFKKYCINCNGKEFYFAEIEFYYYNDNSEELKVKWNENTYPRECQAGDIFYHLSGMDICFNSKLPQNFKEKEDCYGGGILIRSIVEIDTNGNKIVTVGPLTCANKMLNACKGKCMPKLRISKKLNYTPNPQKTFRYLGKTDFDLIEKGENRDGNLKLAFYDSGINKDSWNKARSSYYEKRIMRVK